MDTSVALIIAKTLSPSLRFIRSTEPVVIIDVTVPAAIRNTTSDTTLSETIFSIVPASLFRMLVLTVGSFHRWLIDFSSIAVVITMAMMAVVSSTPVVRGVSVATVIRIWLGIRVVRSPIVPVGIIIVACRISVIASRKSKTESHPGNPESHLSVSTLPGNQSQPAYRQSNREKLFHRFTSSVCFRSSVCCFARNETARLPLPWNRKLSVARF